MTTFTPGCLLVTGGAGFIGSNFVRWVLAHHPDVTVVNLDLLTYAGNVESLADVEQRHGRNGDGRYHFVRGDILDLGLVQGLLAGRTTPRPDAIAHLAAESHVDRSIMGPGVFVETNVKGTLTLLEACRGELTARPRPFRFLHVSTDEVYGSLGPHDAPFCETTPIACNSPYSASKAGSDMLVRAYVETFGLPALITRCSNNYGPYQFPEKFIPLMIIKALRDEPLPVYGDGLNVRDWIHVQDHCAAVVAALFEGKPGAVYNFGGGNEMVNLDVVKLILKKLGKPESLISFVTDRLGHDRRYAIDSSFAQRELKWKPLRSFEEGLEETIQWYIDNPSWWEPLLERAGRY